MLYTAYAWEHEVGLNVSKEYWHSSAEFCYEQFGELFLEDDNNSDNVLEQFEEVLLMFLNLEKGEKFVLMTRGAETRWWSVGEAADTLHKTLPMRQLPFSIDSEPAILCDMALLKSFHRFYLARHLKFFQSGDKLTHAAGFQQFSIFVRCFLKDEDVKHMKASWIQLPEFSDLVMRLDNIPLQLETDGEPMNIFTCWVDGNRLAFFGAFSEFATWQIITQRLLDLPILLSDDCDTFYSENHERDIHLGSFASFVSSAIPHPDSNENPGRFHIERNTPLLGMIANGLSIVWDHGNPGTQPSRRDILWHYRAFFTNNQGAERANKDQNLANYNFRSKGNTSKRMIAMAFIKEMCDGSIIGEKRAAFRGPQHTMAMMDHITKIHNSLQTLCQELGEATYQEKKQRMAQAKGDFEEALRVTHIPSAKENVEGFNISPLLENKLQLGTKAQTTSNLGKD
eukprot:scaffold65887_cov38-Attheya_sp.AAC.2